MLNMRYTLLLLAALSLPVVAPRAVAQLSYSSGQSVSPAFEGWEPNPDGSYDIIFGYMNDNWEEELDVPVGPNNNISPGLPDQGQPTHFYPRRNRFVFSVRVPKDWGNNKEVVWTLTTHGKTIKAYGTLKLDYQIDNVVMMSETGALGAGASTPEIRANKPPVIEISGDASRTVKVGEPLELKTNVTDDGVPKPRPRRTGLLSPAELAKTKDMRLQPPYSVTVGSATGLWVALQAFRADDGPVHITPEQPDTWEDTRTGANSQWAPLWTPPAPPPQNDWTATAVFDKPGDYVLRWHASDGGLTTDHDIHVKVVP
jgi:hypothetical protein